ncbi:MAG TPA: DUF3048 domain-containing protein [Beutenbergiaceae bacterium]|nr:DUF3048 domain-containing protein [Beutenbergiaceae bacterium]
MRKPMRRTAGVLLLAAVAMAGCTSPQAPEPEVVTETPETEADKDHAPEPAIEETWPLSGVPGEVEERPVMSVKVENSAAARPQTGLHSADIVYEEMIEGGQTRFLALFHSQVPEEIGPIRSLRPMDVPLATPYGGQLIFSGAQRAFLDLAHSSSLQILTHDGGAAGFYRSPDRSAPHNVYGNTADFLAQASEPAELEPVFTFTPEGEDPTAVTDGTSASSIQVNFPDTSPGWTWSEDEEVWQRTESGEPAMTTDEGQIGAANVLVLRVQVQNTAFTDPSGSPVPETVVVGSGEAIIASGGHTITGTWTKDDDDDLLQVQTEDGEDVELTPGNTWIELLPVSGSSVSVD